MAIRLTLETLIKFFFIWVLLEGILRKWVSPELSSELFLFKYILVLILLLKLVYKKEATLPMKISLIVSFAFLMICSIISFLIGLYNFGYLVPIFGVLVHFAFLPLLFVMPKVWNTENKLYKFLRYFNVIIFFVFILGIVQYLMPDTHPINRYVAETDYVAKVGEAVRITTIFSYPGTSQYFIVFTAFLTFFQFLVLKKQRFLVALNLLLGSICVLMTGSRYALGSFLFFIIFYFLSLLLYRLIPRVKLTFSVIVLAMGVYGFVFYSKIAESALDNFKQRIETADNINDRLEEVFTPLKFSEEAGFFGLGLGSTANASQPYIVNRSLLPKYWEEESERYVIEFGMIGFIAIVLFRVSLFAYSFSSFKKIRGRTNKAIVLFVLIYQLPAIFVMAQTNYVYIESVIYFTLIGLVFSINRIQKRVLLEDNRIQLC